jgi:hypothetical protein
VQLEGRPADAFELTGSFAPGPTSDGIDPVSEEVTLTIGDAPIDIPAGSFQRTRRGAFRFEGVIGGAAISVRITPQAGGYLLAAQGEGLDLSGATRPVTIALTIGNDAGSTTATRPRH